MKSSVMSASPSSTSEKYLWHPHDELYNFREKLERILVDGEDLEAPGEDKEAAR